MAIAETGMETMQGRRVSAENLPHSAYGAFGDARFYEEPAGENAFSIYVIRDVWADNGKLARCEYAVWAHGEAGRRIDWRPCAEGVAFADIEPAMQRLDITVRSEERAFS